jgi:hypothetical protein
MYDSRRCALQADGGGGTEDGRQENPELTAPTRRWCQKGVRVIFPPQIVDTDAMTGRKIARLNLDRGSQQPDSHFEQDERPHRALV